jgi:large subunit ribosomal protein L10
MSINRQTKETTVASLREDFAKASSFVVLDFQGLDVETVTSLRVAFREKGVTYRVAKNTLIKQAIKGTALESNGALQGFLRGPSGIAFSYEDPSAAAKVVKEFRKGGDKQEKLGIKCGVVESQVFDGKAVEEQLATMPGKDEMRATLLATLVAPMQNLLQLLEAPATNLLYALEAQKTKLEG